MKTRGRCGDLNLAIFETRSDNEIATLSWVNDTNSDAAAGFRVVNANLDYAISSLRRGATGPWD